MSDIFQNGGPWALFALFVAALISLVGWGIRLMGQGRLIQGVVYDDVREQRDGWRKVAETALAANRDLVDHNGRLAAAVPQLAEQLEKTQDLLRAVARSNSHRDPG